MKNLILSILAIFAMSIIVSGCGRATVANTACASITTDANHVSLIGTWKGTSGSNVNTITFSADCSIVGQGSGTMSSQNFVGTFSVPSLGNIPVTITATTGGAYYPQSTGNQNVTYNDATSNQLVLQFPSQLNLTYVKQ